MLLATIVTTIIASAAGTCTPLPVCAGCGCEGRSDQAPCRDNYCGLPANAPACTPEAKDSTTGGHACKSCSCCPGTRGSNYQSCTTPDGYEGYEAAASICGSDHPYAYDGACERGSWCCSVPPVVSGRCGTEVDWCKDGLEVQCATPPCEPAPTHRIWGVFEEEC